MIHRVWRGWTRPELADDYEQLLTQSILPQISKREIPGYRGATLLRMDGNEEVEFMTICRFDDMQAVRLFAGNDYNNAVVPTEAQLLLSRFDKTSSHYQVVESENGSTF